MGWNLSGCRTTRRKFHVLYQRRLEGWMNFCGVVVKWESSRGASSWSWADCWELEDQSECRDQLYHFQDPHLPAAWSRAFSSGRQSNCLLPLPERLLWHWRSLQSVQIQLLEAYQRRPDDHCPGPRLHLLLGGLLQACSLHHWHRTSRSHQMFHHLLHCSAVWQQACQVRAWCLDPEHPPDRIQSLPCLQNLVSLVSGSVSHLVRMHLKGRVHRQF